jgi:hypothetical protein
MTETEAEKIITEYVFSDYKLEALYHKLSRIPPPL